MKKMIALLLTISLLLVVFAGCSAQKQETSEPAATGSTPAATEEQTPAEEQAEAPAETEEAAACRISGRRGLAQADVPRHSGDRRRLL